LRYANDSFSPTFITTIGIDFKIKTIEVDGKRIKLQVSEGSRKQIGNVCLFEDKALSREEQHGLAAPGCEAVC
jgi:hypothetical protein